jgi:endonuclease-8
MPEGDTIHRLASRLAPVLTGREVTGFEARRFTADAARSVVGRRIESVGARGKNLLVRFDDGRLLHVHLQMEGKIWIERARSTLWTARTSEPDLRITVPGAVVVGRRLPICRLLSPRGAERAPDLASLGPDLAADGFDEDEAARRLRELAHEEIGTALLVQRAVAGIGNVYKSEVLFLEGIHPAVRVSALDDERLRSVLRRARSLLRKNLGPGPRTTRHALRGPRLWVYGRAGRPCLRCGTTVARFTQGPPPGRSTYLCAHCQPRRDVATEARSA